MDMQFSNHGSIWIMEPLSDAAREWVSEHIPEDAQAWGKNGIVIEHRYVYDIMVGATNDGLTVVQS